MSRSINHRRNTWHVRSQIGSEREYYIGKYQPTYPLYDEYKLPYWDYVKLRTSEIHREQHLGQHGTAPGWYSRFFNRAERRYVKVRLHKGRLKDYEEIDIQILNGSGSATWIWN